MDTLTDIERRLIDKILYGDLDSFGVLRIQADSAAVYEREYTGRGVFVDIKILKPVIGIRNSERILIDDVMGKSENLKYGFGAVLYVENGFISSLEIYTIMGDWEEPSGNIILYYIGDGERNFPNLF